MPSVVVDVGEVSAQRADDTLVAPALVTVSVSEKTATVTKKSMIKDSTGTYRR